MLNVFMLSVIMLSVIVLSVMTPSNFYWKITHLNQKLAHYNEEWYLQRSFL